MMVIQPLDSSQNKIIRSVRRLLTSKTARGKGEQTVLEGLRLIQEAMKAGTRFEAVLYSPRFIQGTEGKSFVARLELMAGRVLYITDRLMDDLSLVENHQGIMAVVNIPQGLIHQAPEELSLGIGDRPLWVVAAGLQDPGNLGTLIRAAQAAGVDGVGVTRGTVDPVNPKTLRASAGSFFWVPIVRLPSDWPSRMAEQGVTLYSTAIDADHSYDEVDWTQPSVLVLGNEGNGMDATAHRAFQPITIPMMPHADSLNVAMAGSIILFHAAWQRRKKDAASSPDRRL